MRHRLAGKELSRTTSHRKAMRRNMASSLIQHGAIRTTERKAKELRRFVERMITFAKKGTLHARRKVIAALGDRAMTDDEGTFLDKSVVQKLFDEVAQKYTDRPGGYTRIIRLEERRIGDAGSQVILQLVEEDSNQSRGGAGAGTRRRRRAANRYQAVGRAAKAAGDQAPQQQPTDQAQEQPQDNQTEEEPVDQTEDPKQDSAAEAEDQKE